MYRIEIIANKSVEDDITDALEHYLPDMHYTLLPTVYGKGGDDYKMGNTTWPETNFLMFSYVEDEHLEKVKEVVKAVKNKFKNEGIKFFAMKLECSL